MPAARVPSQARIINGAYAELGSKTRVNSINDPVAERALTLWDDIVAEALAEHPWNFQIKRAAVNATDDLDLGDAEYGFVYALPQDCARWLPPARDEAYYFRGEIESGYLLSDRAVEGKIRYISSDIDVSKWSPHFVRYMTLRLAESLADGVTQAEGKKDRLVERAAKALAKAKRIDGLESGNDRRAAVTVQSSWLQARMHPNSQIGR